MPLLALTTLEKIQQVPAKTWWLIGIGLIGIVVSVAILRAIMAGANKILLGIILLLVLFLVSIQWIYDRDEPAFLTPAINRIAPFFPGKVPPPQGAPTPGKPGH
jgi:hypothetical protein